MGKIDLHRRAGWTLAIVVMVGCTAPGENGAPLSQQDEVLLASAKVALPPPGVTAATLPAPDSHGAQLVAQFCGGVCHNLPSPGAHAANDWPVVARRMWLRTEQLDPSLDIPVPPIGERMVLLQYLQEHAFDVAGSDLMDGAGRDAFTTTCARCHALPDPRVHSPEEWVIVVRRMMTHMEEILGESLDQDQFNRISSYLEQVSRASG